MIFLLGSIMVLSTNVTQDAYAADVSVSSTALEGTTIIKMVDGSATGNGITAFSIVPETGGATEEVLIKSFKTERGWIGKKDVQSGSLIFISSSVVNPGEQVTFGIKTDKDLPTFRWATYDSNSVLTDEGRVVSEIIRTKNDGGNNNSTNNGGQNDVQTPTIPVIDPPGITTESVFRTVPEKPSIGSPIRVTGDKFGSSQSFEFLINSRTLGDFVTDDNGHFITTMWIPDDQRAERVDFVVRDSKDNTKTISIRIVNNTGAILDESVEISIRGIPNTVHRGNTLDISGTADPNSTVIIRITNAQGEKVISRTVDVDSRGNWSIEESIIIPADMPFGEYTSTVSDGREEIIRMFSIESDKVIKIEPASLKYDLGEIVVFNGTGLPNKSIEMVLEDPLGQEISSTILQVNGSGIVKFEFPTSQTTKKGTYTLIVTQDPHKEFVFVGIGEKHNIPVDLEFDKLNYKRSETAIILMSGEASAVVNLRIINPAGDNEVGKPMNMTLGPDGRGTYKLSMAEFAPGGYTAVISIGNTQSVERFGVDLQTGSEIEINTTKDSYYRGDSILILGTTEKNVLLNMTMADQNGTIIKSKEIFSDNKGKISEKSFRIPAQATAGMWEIRAKTGAVYDVKKIEVITVMQDEIMVTISESGSLHGTEIISIQAVGVRQTVTIDITAEDGTIIDKLKAIASDHNVIAIPWKIPDEIEPGTYIVRVADPFRSVESTFEVE